MSKERRNDSFSPPVVGGSSLLVIFAVLCLTTFALLSLSSVKANERLAEGSRNAVNEYYAADLEAEKVLAQIRTGEIPEGVEVNGELYSYACKISENRELQVKLRYNGMEWTVEQWMAVSTAEENDGDSSVNVWDGQDPTQ